MNDLEIYAKTEFGRDEMRTRARRLQGALRNILLLVDGNRPVSQLRGLIEGAKAPADSLEQLLAMDLIALRVAAPAMVPVAPPPPPSPAPAPPPVASGPVPPPIVTSAPPPAAARPAPPAPAIDAAKSAAATEPAKRYNRLYNLINEIVSDYLGLRGYFMQLKIEKCSTAEDLLALQEELHNALAKAHGREVASDLIARIQALA